MHYMKVKKADLAAIKKLWIIIEEFEDEYLVCVDTDDIVSAR